MFLKITWRNLLKDRRFTLLNLIGLATGLACVLFIYLWVNDETHIGKLDGSDNRRYQVMQNGHWPDGVQTGENTPGLLAKALKEELPEVQYAVATIHPGGLTNDKGIFIIGDKRVEATSIFAGKDMFKVFPYQLMQGEEEQVLSRPDGVVLSDETAMRLFNTTSNVIGKTVNWNIDGFSGLYTVTGVFKKLAANNLDKFDVMFNYDDLYLPKNTKLTDWGNSDPATYIILKPGTDINRFNAKIEGFIKTKRQESNATLFVQKYADKYLHNHYENGKITGGRIEYVRLFSIIAVFILIIACINFMNLSTARASGRLKEVGVRKVVGAGRLALVLQYLGESLLMAVLAQVIAVVLVIALLPQFNQLTGKQLVLHADAPVIIAALVITLLTGVAAGSYPALYISGFKPVAILKGKITASAGEVWVRKGLVVFQFTLSAIFIVCVLVVYKQMQLIQTKNLGYNRDNIIYFEKGGLTSANKDDYKPGGKYSRELETMLDDIKNVPGVVNAANFRHNITNRHGGTTAVNWPGKPQNMEVSFTDIAVGYGFTETMGIQMKEGHSFTANDSNQHAKVVINEAAVEVMGLKNPVGKKINIWGEDREIIGVAKNFNYESLYEGLKPCFFDYTFGNRASKIMVKVQAGTEKQTLAGLEKLYHQYNPGLPFEYKFLDADYQALYASENRVSALSKYFAALAVIISCLGLFGLAAFTAQKRQKEIGIRKVVGASVGRVVVMLSKDFLRLVLIAVLVAFPIAGYLTSHWLHGFAYRVEVGAGVFIIAGFAVLLITILTTSTQAIKAAMMNPVKALKE